MNTNEFRNEVTKIMPGYTWTVKKPYRFKNETATGFAYMEATGIQIAGFNRMSTLKVERRVDDDGSIVYKGYISGYGKGTPPAMWAKAGTLARALRRLQDQCDAQRVEYATCVGALEKGRLATLKKNPKIPVDNSEAAGV